MRAGAVLSLLPAAMFHSGVAWMTAWTGQLSLCLSGRLHNHGNVTGRCKGLGNILRFPPTHKHSLSPIKMNVTRQRWTYHAPNFKCLITNYPHMYLFFLPDGRRLTLRPGLPSSFLSIACSVSFFHLSAAAFLKATAQLTAVTQTVCLFCLQPTDSIGG